MVLGGVGKVVEGEVALKRRVGWKGMTSLHVNVWRLIIAACRVGTWHKVRHLQRVSGGEVRVRGKGVRMTVDTTGVAEVRWRESEQKLKRNQGEPKCGKYPWGRHGAGNCVERQEDEMRIGGCTPQLVLPC